MPTLAKIRALRAEEQRLRKAAQAECDGQQRVKFAISALRLAERVEALERAKGDHQFARQSVARYSAMLREVIEAEHHRRHIEDMLADMQFLLAQSTPSNADRLICELNITLFAHRLYDERDPVKRQKLQRLLIDEEDRYGLQSWHLELADRHIARGEARIKAQQQLIESMEGQGSDITLARSLLENFIVGQALFSEFREMIADSLEKNLV